MLDQAMSETMVQAPAAEARQRLSDRIDPARLKRLKDQEYRVMYWLIVPVCLVIAITSRAARACGATGDAFHSSHSVARGNVFQEASRLAHTVIPFAFWR
ncbi:MAG: hypothetical protein AAF416_10785 [Pseudomonadota bacterium]